MTDEQDDLGIDIRSVWNASTHKPCTVTELPSISRAFCWRILPAAMYTILEPIVRASAVMEAPDPCSPRSTVFTISKNTSKRTMEVASASPSTCQGSLPSLGPRAGAVRPQAEVYAGTELFQAAVKHDSHISDQGLRGETLVAYTAGL